jgi:glyoxylase-like metal-dependent hydrolase (beta-lactamase superfamily II)
VTSRRPIRAGMEGVTAMLVATLMATLAACAPAALREASRALDVPGAAALATTNGANASMIWAMRTSAGVVVVDLGWARADRALRDALGRIGARPEEVAAVLLTHGHRDHTGAWRAVQGATFWVGAGEAGRLRGERARDGWIPRLADRLHPPALPRPGELRVGAIGRDTALVFGNDTVRAFLVPGHTAGSTAYLARGVLFVGDAVSHGPGGLRPARRGYSADVRLARSSLARLGTAVAPHAPRLVCTAHARCAASTPALWARLAGGKLER